ncbi:MAG: uracil-DNA glycosylase family protein, partial [Planctomycetota bacterium]
LDFLPAPLTVRAAGVFTVSTGGEARLDMSNVTSGTLTLGAIRYEIAADVTKGTLVGTATASGSQLTSRVALTIKRKNVVSFDGITVTIVTGLEGTKDGQPISLARKNPSPASNAELAEFDAGPPAAFQSFFATCPDYASTLKAAGVDPTGKMFWYNFGALFYRGRLDGTARVMVIASDPGPEECLPFVRRPMVGDAGQRVQSFLGKLGIDRSYVLVNAYAYAMRPTYVNKGYGRAILTETFTSVSPVITLTAAQKTELHKITTWRHEFFTRVARSSPLTAIVPMGDNAWTAYKSWMASLPTTDPLRKIPVVKVVHPSAVDRNPMAPRPDSAIVGWRNAIDSLRKIVAPDPGQTNTGPNYGEYFTENDYKRVPRRDLGWRTPLNVGDNARTRQVTGDYNDAHRPSPDDFKTLIYVDPVANTRTRYVFLNGAFHPELTTDDAGQAVKVDADGIRVP